MSKPTRIPKKLAEFIAYITLVNTYLHETLPGGTTSRGIHLGMTTAQLTALDNFVTSLVSGDHANPGIWDLHINKDTKTKKTRADLIEVMYNFSIFFRPILNQIAANPITTNGDRIPLNIAIPKTGGHHQQKAKIAGLCYVHVTPMINGDIRFSFTSSADSKRANKAEGADAIEIAGRIDTPADPATKLKYKPLASADDGTEKTIHTKSGFILKLGSGNTGNYFQFYCRWTNTKNPDIAGSWTGPLVVVIP